MLHKLAERIAFFVYGKKESYPIDIYVYGFELIISSIVETSALIIIGLLINKPLETLLFLFSFSSIRFFCGGYHAKSYFKCFVVTLCCYMFILFMNNLLLTFDTWMLVMIALIEWITTFVFFSTSFTSGK